MKKVDLLKEIISPEIIDEIEKKKSIDRTIEDIREDIEFLGIKGGYSVEQLLTPQDCRRLSYEIERLNNIINELERYINEEYIYDELGMKIFDASELQDKLHELKGSDKE